MIRLAWLLLHLVAATFTANYRWSATVISLPGDNDNSTIEHDFLKLEIIDTEEGEIVCINRDIYPTVTFTCDVDYRRTVVMALLVNDADSWQAPIPTQCSNNRLRYDIDSVHIGHITIPQTTDSTVYGVELTKALSAKLTSGYEVGSASTDWSRLNTGAKGDLLALARIDSGRVKRIVGLLTNDNFINVAPLFDVTVDLAAVEDDFVENIMIHTFTHQNDNNLSVILGHTELLSSPGWNYWRCDETCIEDQAAWEDWEALTDLVGNVVIDGDQAFMVDGDQVSKYSLSDSAVTVTQTVTSVTDGVRHYPSAIAKSTTSFIVEWDEMNEVFLIHVYANNETTTNHTIKLDDNQSLCDGIDKTAVIVKSQVADVFAFVDKSNEKTCMVQVYSSKSSLVGDLTSSTHDVSMIVKLLDHSGISTKLVDIDALLQLTFLKFTSSSGLLETYRISFNDLLLDRGLSLQGPRISTTVTGHENGYEVAHYDVREDSVNVVFYYNDAGTIKLTNEMTFAADVTSDMDCIHLNLISTGEQRKMVQFDNGSFEETWVPFNVEYYHEFSPKPPKKVENVSYEEEINEQFNRTEFVKYAILVNSQIEDYAAANADFQRSMPSNVFLSNNERLVMEARIQGNTGQEEAIASTELVYSLHEDLVGTTFISRTEEISRRGTEKTIRLKIKPSTLKKAKSGVITSASLITFKVSPPGNTCIEQFQVETHTQNLAPSEAVTRVSIGCPPNRQLRFDAEATIASQMEKTVTGDLNCFSDADDLKKSNDRTGNKLPMCVKFEAGRFRPNLTINDPFTKSSIPFNDNYTIQVLNGEWLDYKDGEYEIPNFEDEEVCINKEAPLGTKYKCMGPFFKKSNNNTNDYIKEINQQAKKGLDGLANLKAIWDSAQEWKPVKDDGTPFNEPFKMFSNLPNSTIEWVCKYNSTCHRLWPGAMPPLAFHGLRTMFFGFANMFLTEKYLTYHDFHAPEYFLHISVTNDLEKVFEDFNVPEQHLQNNCILETRFTLRVGYVSLDAITNLWITLISFGTLMAGFGTYVMLQQHELAVEKCKDQVYDFFDGSGNAERALYDAEYERKMTLISDKQLRRNESSYSQSSNMRQTSVLNNYGRQTSTHEMAKRISHGMKRTSQVQPPQQPGAYVLGQHNTAVQRRLSAVQGAAKDDMFKRGSVTIKKS